MTFYTYIVLVALLALGLIYGTAHADPLVQIDLVEQGPKHPYVGIVDALDNQNGTTSLLVDVCGSIYKFTVDNSKLDSHGDEINEFISEQIEEICK